MQIIKNILRKTEFRPLETVYAHCDIPCGVYEPDSMSWAAETVLKMMEKLEALEKSSAAYTHDVARMTLIKEKFAQKCKEELLILWTDYFKPEHFQKWPDLTEKIHLAAKQCSTVKRTVAVAEGKKLKQMVADIASIYKESKQ